MWHEIDWVISFDAKRIVFGRRTILFLLMDFVVVSLVVYYPNVEFVIIVNSISIGFFLIVFGPDLNPPDFSADCFR